MSNVNIIELKGSVYFIKFKDGSKAYLVVEEENNKMYLIETYTPKQHRGKGYARMLVEKAIEDAEKKGLSLVPICSYAVYYFMKNPTKRYILSDEYMNLSDKDWEKLFKRRLEEERRKRS